MLWDLNGEFRHGRLDAYFVDDGRGRRVGGLRVEGCDPCSRSCARFRNIVRWCYDMWKCETRPDDGDIAVYVGAVIRCREK